MATKVTTAKKPATKPTVRKTAATTGKAKTKTATTRKTAATVKKPAAKKSKPAASTPAKKKAATAKSAPRKTGTLSPEERYRMVQDAAYFIAEKNGFQADSMDYWIAAEAEITFLLSDEQ